jgi:hypothetical protein
MNYLLKKTGLLRRDAGLGSKAFECTQNIFTHEICINYIFSIIAFKTKF